jgi:diguanylate cyclase
MPRVLSRLSRLVRPGTVLPVGLLWIAAHASGLLGPLTDLTFVLIALMTLVTTIIGTRRHRPSGRAPWFFMALSVVFFLVGGGIRQAVSSFGDLSADRSLLPDYIILPGYVSIVVAMVLFVRCRQHGRAHDADALLDSVIAALSALALAWVYLITPALTQDAPLKVRLSLAVYPPLSTFIAALSARISFTVGVKQTIAQRLFLTATISMVVGDVIFTLGDARLVVIPQRLADVPYALAFVALAGSCLHPTMRDLTEPVASDQAAPTRWRLLIVALALLVPILVSFTTVASSSTERTVLFTIAIALTGAGVLRFFRALRTHARSEARFAYQATHDRLTGLPNRSYLTEHLVRCISRAEAEGSSISVIFVDVDRFKLVNDTGGHTLGDQLLISVAERLVTGVGDDGLVARIGGDEFVVVLTGLDSVNTAVDHAEAIRSLFDPAFDLDTTRVFSSASLGVTHVQGDDLPDDPDRLIRDADTAMYRAKEAGRDGLAVFDAKMRDAVAERLDLERDLRSAITGGQLHVHFQPIVAIVGGEVSGFEALVRWSHPTRGLIPPTTFIPIAEENGSIIEIGAWVLSEATRELAIWRTSLGQDLTVAVNLSSRQLRDDRLVEQVRRSLVENDLPGSALCLELTESLLMEDPVAAAATLRSVREMGVRLSIDDFGTGYSSLSYLKRFPVDTVKIDRSFVEDLDQPGSADESLVAAIIAMASALGVSTVAEGVETTSQAERLRILGAERAQGYLYARPLAPAAIPPTIERLGLLSKAKREALNVPVSGG